MNSKYPGLDAASKATWDLLESYQPYHADFAWLRDLNKLNNEGKHDVLTPQVKKEVGKRVSADIRGGGNVTWDPGAVKFGQGVSIGGVPIDPATQLPVPSSQLQITFTTWVDFHFRGTEISAMNLLKSATAGIERIVNGVRAHL